MLVGCNPGSGLRRGVLRLWDCGVTWAHLEPRPGEWTFDALDSLVDAATDGVMLVLGHPPQWAARGGTDGRQAGWLPPGTNRPPVDGRLWSEYIGTVARRYAGRIGWYQVWNEPADPAFYSGSLDRLARLTARARDTVHAIDPAAQVVSPPLQPRPASGWPRRAQRLVQALVAQGAPVDIWSCHVYPETGRGPDRWAQMLADTQRLLAGHGQAARPLWVTETNYNVPDGPALPDATAGALVRATEETAERLGVGAVVWYAATGWFGVQPSAFP